MLCVKGDNSPQSYLILLKRLISNKILRINQMNSFLRLKMTRALNRALEWSWNTLTQTWWGSVEAHNIYHENIDDIWNVIQTYFNLDSNVLLLRISCQRHVSNQLQENYIITQKRAKLDVARSPVLPVFGWLCRLYNHPRVGLGLAPYVCSSVRVPTEVPSPQLLRAKIWSPHVVFSKC